MALITRVRSRGLTNSRFPIPDLEARPQRPAPVALLSAGPVECDGVIPPEERETEQVESNTSAVATQRCARRRDVRSGRVTRYHFLSARPRETDVIEHQPVDWRKRDREQPEIEAPYEWEPKLSV